MARFSFDLWGGGGLRREPLDVYRDKARTRASDRVLQRDIGSVLNPFSGGRSARRREPLPDLPSRGRSMSRAEFYNYDVRGIPQEQRLPAIPSRKKKDGDGGIIGGIKKYGGKALDFLDAATETSLDLGGLGPATGPVMGAVRLFGDESPDVAAHPRDVVRAARKPKTFVSSQAKDFQRRSGQEQILAGAIADPTNLFGVGLGPKAISTGSRLRQGGRAARISGRILEGLGKADEALDVAQARYGREVIGGIGGYTASAMSGGDFEQNLEAAAGGAIAGRLSRHLPRIGTREAGRLAPVGLSTIEETGDLAADITRKGNRWVAPDGTEFTGTGAQRRAREYVEQKALVGQRVPRYGGGEDIVEDVRMRGDGSFEYSVRDAETGERRTHATKINPKGPRDKRPLRERLEAPPPAEGPVRNIATEPPIGAATPEPVTSRRRTRRTAPAAAETPPVASAVASPTTAAPGPSAPIPPPQAAPAPTPTRARPPRAPEPTAPLAEAAQPEKIDLLMSRALENERPEAARRGLVTNRRGTEDTRFIRFAKRETDHIARELVDAQVDQIRAQAERVGLRVEQDATGNWVLSGSGVPIEDVVERSTAAGDGVYAGLTPEQQAVIDDIARVNDSWNQTIEFHGGTVPMRDSIEGQYFPRRVVEMDGIGRNAPSVGGGRKVGGSRIGRRSKGSVEEGISEGLRYKNPWDALKDGMRIKANIAQQNYLGTLIDPLRAPADAVSGFGARPLRENHPLLSKKQFVGQTESEAILLGDRPTLFPTEIADQLDSILTPRRLSETPQGRVVSFINSVMTPLRASADVSFELNQGLGFAESNPRNAMKALHGGVKAIASAMGDPDQYFRLMDSETTRANALLQKAGVQENALEWFTKHGSHYASENVTDEFLFPSKVERIPVVGSVVRWSNDTFGRYLNYARHVLNTDALERAVNKGLVGDALDKEMRGAINSTNRMTGWTDKGFGGDLGKLGMFAPRFFQSNIEQIATAFTKGGLEGSLARRHLVKLFGTATVITYAANAARGYNTDIDPRSHNFLRIRNVGGHDVSLLGPFTTIIRGASQLVAGQPGEMSGGARGTGVVFGTKKPKPAPETVPDFLRTKASPVLSTAWTLMKGETFDQRPVTSNPMNKEFYTETLPGIGRESIPFSAQAAIEGFEEGGVTGALMSGGVSSTGLVSSDMTPIERRDIARDEIAQDRFGKPYDELSGEQKSKVNESDRVTGYQKEADRRKLERTGDTATRTRIDQTFREEMTANAEFLRKGKDEQGREFTGPDYRQAYHDAVQRRIGGFATLEEASGGDKEVEGYFNLYEEAKRANGSIDYDEFDRLEAAYLREHPGVLEKIDKVVGARDDATMRKFRAAREQAAEYYAIPAYRGMELEDAQRASEVLSRANALVANGYAANRKAALNKLIDDDKITRDEALLALRAAKVGSNPERRAYRVAEEHAAFRTFYQDLTMAEAEELPTIPVKPKSSGGGSSSAVSMRSRRATGPSADRRRSRRETAPSGRTSRGRR